MRTPIRLLWALAVLAPAWATAAVAAPPVIGTQQINRFEAIRQLQQAVKQNSKSLADWVILGELAHEVAIDLPADQAGPYYKMSRDAYENALELAPQNVGLQAAVQFAKDAEQGLDRFEKSRNAATQMYLAARRRDLAATQFTPSLRVYGPPIASAGGMAGTGAGAGAGALGTTGATDATGGNTGPANANATTSAASNVPPTTTTPAGTGSAGRRGVAVTNETTGLSSANMGVRQIYSYPTYQTYVPRQGAPMTYQQYSNSYYPPTYDANQAGQAVTLQHYYLQQNAQQGSGLPIPGDPTGRPGGQATTIPSGGTTTPGGTTTTPPTTPR